MSNRPNLILAGGGHVHVEVLRRLAIRPSARDLFAEITLISPESSLSYSGLLPATIAGHIERQASRIDIAALAEAARVDCRWTTLTRVDANRRRIRTADQAELEYRLLSLDIGAEPVSVAGADQAHVIPVKPVSKLWAGLDRIEHALQQRGHGPAIAVIGGGAGGVELALSLAHRWRHHPGAPRITLFARGDRLMASHEASVRDQVERAMIYSNINVATNTPIQRIESDRVVAENGHRFTADAVFVATGARPPTAWRADDLALDEQGFVQVDAHLASISHPDVRAAGDIAALPEPRPKSGVYAVRAAPTLAANLEQSAQNRALYRFKAQKHALALITLGDRRAIASRGWPIAPTGYAPWCLKNMIDRRFVARYQHLARQSDSTLDSV